MLKASARPRARGSLYVATEAADHADRLRLLKHDIHLVELAVEMALKEGDEDREAIVMTLRRLQGEVEGLSDDILTADKAKAVQS